MPRKLCLPLCFCLSSATVLAAGIDRSGQDLGILFETGRRIEFSFSTVTPEIRGRDLLGGSTGNVTEAYQQSALGIKSDVGGNWSWALIVDQPYGADLTYGKASPLLGGTRVEEDTLAVAGLLRYRLNDHFSLHGGARLQQSSALIRLAGLAYGPVSGYQVKLEADSALAPIVGASFESPASALRLSVSYQHAVRHRLRTVESAPLAPLNGRSTTTVSTPRSVNIDFQTGISQSTLLFARWRWVRWSEFRVDPARFVAVTGEGLIDPEDADTWTLGLAHRLAPAWSLAVALEHEPRGRRLSSPLAPANGRSGVSLAAIHSHADWRIIAGLSYHRLGNARLETGTPDVERATMRGSSALGFGLRIARSF